MSRGRKDKGCSGGALVAPVDGRERDGADVKGVPGVVVELHGLPGGLLAGSEHLPRLLGHGGRRVELQQAAAEGRARVEVLNFEKDGHGRAQGERQVDRLQLAVREVRGQLGRPLHVLLELLALDLDLDGDQVVLGDGQELLHLVDLLAGLDDQHRDGQQDLLKQLVGL